MSETNNTNKVSTSPKALAEKILTIVRDAPLGTTTPQAIEAIAEILSAALEKAKLEERQNIIHASYSKEELQQIRAQAFEEAAKIAYGMGDEGIGNTLRQKAKEI